MRLRLPALHRSAVVASCVAAIGIGATLTATHGYAQWRRRIMQEPNASYDGRFTFVRLSYTVYGRSGWEFDYPAMERNFMTILNDLTAVHPHVRESNIHAMDDPELGRYPVAYLSEPGWWRPDDSQAAGLRTWLAKGGFLIVDDFYGPYQWQNFEQSMKKVLPNGRIIPLDVTHPIFDSFFKIQSLDGMSHPDDVGWRAEYKGIFEDNDPKKRLMVIINYNNDIGDYMEWSGQGYYAINFSNDAYKLATNYVLYALSH
ncbi:MAG TPA: DUF4159 domain-containing protein [Gemmatimonadaceae bacterium]|nr:DUF4159 domain-containing protein [Gemmatimonadaceae bacterium]